MIDYNLGVSIQSKYEIKKKSTLIILKKNKYNAHASVR